MTAEIVSAYARNNPLPASELTSIISTVHGSLVSLEGSVARKPEPGRPAVSIRRSIQPNYLICLEDGKKMKMLKRHLCTIHGLAPEEYRAKWGLPFDYPMVALNDAKQRSELAKKIGLGRKTRKRGGSQPLGCRTWRRGPRPPCDTLFPLRCTILRTGRPRTKSNSSNVGCPLCYPCRRLGGAIWGILVDTRYTLCSFSVSPFISRIG